MKLKDIKPMLHELPVWVNTSRDAVVRYERGEAVPALHNKVRYITVNGAHELVIEIENFTWDDQYAIAEKFVGTSWDSWYALKREIWDAGLGTADFEESDMYMQIYEIDGEEFNAVLYVPWDGANSNKHLYGSDLSRAIRNDLKAHGIYGVTVRCGHGGWTDHITATITCSPNDFTDFISFTGEHYSWNDTYDINHYHLEMYESDLTPTLMQKINHVVDCIESYRYDDSNSMVDYFNTNMYFSVVLKVKGVKQ